MNWGKGCVLAQSSAGQREERREGKSGEGDRKQAFWENSPSIACIPRRSKGPQRWPFFLSQPSDTS